MSRLDNFDLAKAFAIVLVVIGHFYPSDSPEWYVLFRSWMYTFHMPLFMFISGYIYIDFKKDEKKIEFVKKKVQRLMLPYIVVSVLIISLKLLSQKGMFVENPVTFFSYVQCLYKPSAGYFLWFVWSLFSCFLIIPFFKSPASRLILFVIAVLLHYIVPAINITAFALNETQRNFMWFVLGCCICDCKCCKSLNICETKWYLIFKGLVLLFFDA